MFKNNIPVGASQVVMETFVLAQTKEYVQNDMLKISLLMNDLIYITKLSL